MTSGGARRLKEATMKLSEAKNLYIDEDRVYCADHCSPSKYVLEIGSVQIPLCESCIEELKKAVEEV